MPHATTNQHNVDRPSMSARVSMTRAEVTRIDEASLSLMRTRLERWGAQLSALETNVLALSGAAESGIRENIRDLKEKHQIARVWFDELKNAGAARWGILSFSIQSAWRDFETALDGLRSQVPPGDSQREDNP
jgi:hypothetical protein